jgi:putative ATP-dependent endonuclease of OLD family
MIIKKIRIENFRGFQDETVHINRYSAFVGANGAGKSTVLHALNVFFKEQTGSDLDVTRLTDEDFFLKLTDRPIRVTVTFGNMRPEAEDALADYVRRHELVITAEAKYDADAEVAVVRHFGQRSGMEQFRPYFEADKRRAKTPELNGIYDGLRGLIDLPAARSKEDKAAALQAYEAQHPERCVLIESEDSFYGINGAGKLAPFVQWIYVPAVKNAGDESQEAKNTAFGRLIARAITTRTEFDVELATLKAETLLRYREILSRNQAGLDALAAALQRRLEEWAHPNARLGIEWLSDAGKSVVVQQPVAAIKTGEGDFLGDLARMGHGLQRSYLLALLQELAASEVDDAPTLLLGCEEPELYQHPPQARHLAEVFEQLAKSNNQVLVTTHSPLFVSGEGFENIRLVRRAAPNAGTTVSQLTFDDLCAEIRRATGVEPRRNEQGLVAKIHQALQPGITEMFFARIPILVEGLEDISYLTTHLYLSSQWTEFRRLGCHFVPVNCKDRLIKPLAILKQLRAPVFVMFDTDSDVERPAQRAHHERDNLALMRLLGLADAPFPDSDVWGPSYVFWKTNLTDRVRSDFGAHADGLLEEARRLYPQEGGLEKHDLFIADYLSIAWDRGIRSETLERVCQTVFAYAQI